MAYVVTSTAGTYTNVYATSYAAHNQPHFLADQTPLAYHQHHEAHEHERDDAHEFSTRRTCPTCFRFFFVAWLVLTALVLVGVVLACTLNYRSSAALQAGDSVLFKSSLFWWYECIDMTIPPGVSVFVTRQQPTQSTAMPFVDVLSFDNSSTFDWNQINLNNGSLVTIQWSFLCSVDVYILRGKSELDSFLDCPSCFAQFSVATGATSAVPVTFRSLENDAYYFVFSSTTGTPLSGQATFRGVKMVYQTSTLVGEYFHSSARTCISISNSSTAIYFIAQGPVVACVRNCFTNSYPFAYELIQRWLFVGPMLVIIVALMLTPIVTMGTFYCVRKYREQREFEEI